MSSGNTEFCVVVYDGSKAPRAETHLHAAVTVRGHRFVTGKQESVPADLAALLQRAALPGTVTVLEGTPALLPPPMSQDVRAAILSQKRMREAWGTDPAACAHELATPLSAEAKKALAGSTKDTVAAILGGKHDSELFSIALHAVLHGLGDLAKAAIRRATDVLEDQALKAG